MKTVDFKKYLLTVSVILFAASGIAIANPTTVETVRNGEVFPKDKFAAAQNIRNDGTIKGDLFFWAQSLSSSGTVTGDIIGAGQDVVISGNVQGNIRSLGKNINLSGSVSKNVIACGSVVVMAEGTKIDGSLIACGQNINVSGKVKGNTIIFGEKVILQGEFFGDVSVNDIQVEKKDVKDLEIKDSLTVLPGTVIHGTLKYSGKTADIQKGAKVNDFKWTKTLPSQEQLRSIQIHDQVWKFVKLIFSTVALFLMGYLLYKSFPSIFNGMGLFASQKPWNAVLFGLAAVFSTIAALIIFILMMILAFISSPGFGFIFGITSVSLYAAIFFFSSIPVGFWFGNLIMKNNPNVLQRFGLGLILFNLTVYLLNLLGDLHIAGSLFNVLSFIIRFGAILFGTGILLHAVRDFYSAAKRG